MRFGRLIASSLVHGGNGRICSVVFRCDCGRYVKLSVQKIKDKRIPFECRSCADARPKARKRPRRSLRWSYPTEWKSWKNLKDRKSRPRVWDRFRAFLRDMGDRPPGHVLRRRDPAKPHGKHNSYWALPDTTTPPLLLNGEQVTPGYLRSHYGIRKSFTRHLRDQGVSDALEIIQKWKDR